MTRIKDLLKKCEQQKDKGIISAIQLVKGNNNSYAQNTEGGITALSFLDKALKTLILDEEAKDLTYLYLSGCAALEEIVFDITLPSLTHLYLDECGLIELEIPTGSMSLEQIYVQKQKGGLKKIVFKGNCPELQLLDASNNALTEFTLQHRFSQLKYLYLNDNPQLIGFSAADLPTLNTLSIKNTRLKRLPEDIILSDSLKVLYAAGNAPKNIPKVFLGRANSYASQNTIAAARTWFEELRDYPSDENKIIKLMLTGNGNAGKSSVLCALKNGKCAHDHGSTHGIQIDVVKDKAIEYNVWDFGGQEVYHGTHRLFMESEALQVILFDPETEELAKRGI